MANTQLDIVNVLDTVTGISDCTLNQGTLQTKGAPAIKMADIFQAELLDPLAEGLQVVTLTPVAAASSTYQFTITQQNNSTGQLVQIPFSYVSLASGDTATTIGNAFRTLIGLQPSLKITASGTATLILTAQTGSPNFSVSITSVGGGLTQASTVSDGSSIKSLTNTSGTSTVSAGGTTLGGTVALVGAANGDTVTFTLAGSDSVALRNGKTLVAGDTFTTILGNVTNSGTLGVFSIGPAYDARISNTGITVMAAATLVAPVWSAQPARGTYTQLTAKGVTGITSGNIYAELDIYANMRSKTNGMDARNTLVTTYINTSDADYASTLRTAVINNLAAVSSGTTATPKAAAIG